MEAKDTLLTAAEMSEVSREKCGGNRDKRPYITLLLLAQAEKSFLAGEKAGAQMVKDWVGGQPERDWRREQEC